MRITAITLALILTYFGVAFTEAMQEGAALKREAQAVRIAQEHAIADERWRFCQAAFPAAVAQQRWCYVELSRVRG